MLYIRLFFTAGSRLMRRLIYGGIASVALFYAAYIVAFISISVPRRGESIIMAMVRHKALRDRLFIANAVGSVLTDLYAWMLPLPVFWRLQMPWRKKLGLYALFGSGLMYV
jgi:hypothetical protein